MGQCGVNQRQWKEKKPKAFEEGNDQTTALGSLS